MDREKLDIGIVCGGCRTFNTLGSVACSSCVTALQLRPYETVPMAESGPPAVEAMNSVPSGDTSPNLQLSPAAIRKAAEAAQALGTEGEAPPEVIASLIEENPMEPARHYVCRSCSSAVPAGHKFCGRCGTPIPVQVRELKTNYFGDMQNPTKAKLILIRGEGMDGLSFHLKAEQHIVGREGQLIFPDDPFVSPRHANFFYRDGHLVVRDEGSLNGVYVRIRGSVPIKPSQTFLAGEQLFRLEMLDQIGDDGPDPDGTSFYASPRKDSTFRLCQVFRGDAVGMCVHATGSSMTVGRDGADLNFPEDLFMSGEHCRIDQKGSDYTLTDLDSRNGTYVRIGEERVLEHGDYVFIGRKLLRVEMNTN